MSVYAAFFRHGAGEPELQALGPFDMLELDEDRLLGDGEIVAEREPDGCWRPDGDDVDFTLSITSHVPRMAEVRGY